MSTDPRTPAEVADWLTENATDVAARAAQRFPRDRAEQLRDAAEQLRLLVETAAEHLQQFEIERERHVSELARKSAQLDTIHATLAQTRDNYDTRVAELKAKIPPNPAFLDGDLTDAQRVTRLIGKVKRLTVQRDKYRDQRNELRDKLFDQTLAEARKRLTGISGGAR